LQVGCIRCIFAWGRLTPSLVGALSDKFGSYSFIYCGLTLRALGFLAFPITDSFTTVCAAAVAIGLGGACFETPSYSLIQYVDSKIKDRCVVMLNMGLNLGVILGPLVGSLISMISLSIPFYLSGCLFLLLAMGIFVSPKFDAIKLNASSIKSIFKQPFHNTAFIFLLFIAFPWFTVFAQMFISLPMEMVRISGVDSWASAVFLINGIIGVAVLKIWLVGHFKIPLLCTAAVFYCGRHFVCDYIVWFRLGRLFGGISGFLSG